MLTNIKNFFENHLQSGNSQDEVSLDHRLKVATVALLLETARADFDVLDDELLATAQHAQNYFSLSDDETEELLALAEEEAKNVTCYHEFTSLINQSYKMPEKITIVEMMWRVAYADKHLEKYEEALVRKIADLLYVPHAAFISAKHRVREELGIK